MGTGMRNRGGREKGDASAGKPVVDVGLGVSCRLRWALVLVLLMVLPFRARADVGTPLVWGTAFQLLFGNALLGCAEG